MPITSDSLKSKILAKLTNTIMNPQGMNDRIEAAMDAISLEDKEEYTEEELNSYSNSLWYAICKGITDHIRLNDKMWSSISAAIIEEIKENAEIAFPTNLESVGSVLMTPRVRYIDATGTKKYGYLSVYNDTYNQLGVVQIVPEETVIGINNTLPANQEIDESINPIQDKDANTIGVI